MAGGCLIIKPKTMRRVFTNADDVIHLWANQIQNEARSSNVFFENKRKIYSYGHHYLLAEFIDQHYNIVVINDSGYSVTTSKHISSVTQATRHKTQFFTSEAEPARVLYTIKSNIKSLERARKPELYLEPSFKLFERLNEFIEVSGRKHLKKSADYKEIQALVKALEKDPKTSSEAVKRNAKLRAKREQAQRAARIKKERDEFYNYKRRRIDINAGVDYLRTSERGEFLETSQGVQIAWGEAKRLLKLYDAKKIIGESVNGLYKVVKANGILQAGCHNIERAEIERMRPVIEKHRGY